MASDRPTYIVDFYAFLEMPESAALADLRHAARRQTRNHPDRLPSDISLVVLGKARQVYELALAATKVFSTKESRSAYDVELASYPSALRSKDGTPIVVIGSSALPINLDPSRYVARVAEADSRSDAFTNYSEATEKVMSRLYAADASDADLRVSYANVLMKKALGVGARAFNRGSLIGLSANDLMGQQADFAALPQKLEAALGQLERAGSKAVYALESSGLSHDVATSTVGSATDLAGAVGREVMQLMRQQKEILDKRRVILDGHYLSDPTKLHSSVLVYLHGENGAHLLSFEIDASSGAATSTDLADEFTVPLSTDELLSLQQRGFSAIDAIVDQERDIDDQLSDILTSHLQRFELHQVQLSRGASRSDAGPEFGL